MSFPKYDRYKNSGVEWLGEVPEHWEVGHVKRLATKITDGSHISPETENGVYAFISTKDVRNDSLDFDNCLRTSVENYEYLVRTGCKPIAGDVLFSKDGTIGRTVVIKEDRDFVVASSLIIISPDQNILSSVFLNYLCQSSTIASQVECFVKGAGLPRLSIQNLLRIIGVFPPLPEQRSIATFLDRETTKIDELIAEQRQLIDLLKEKRQAVISHAVTKGLNPDAPMKDSAIEWLGEVPEHWEAVRIKYILKSLEQGWSPQCENFSAEDSGWGVLKVGCVNGGVFNPDENKALPAAFSPVPELAICVGDVLISRANTRELVGSAAVALADYPNLLLCDKLYRLRLIADLCNPEFLVLYLSTPQARSQLELAASGASSSMLNIGQATVLEMFMPLPTIEEQIQITSYVGNEANKFQDLISEAHHAIALLQERRTALISAAVTGKIDVRSLV